jgi:thymidylate synthase ThyX
MKVTQVSIRPSEASNSAGRPSLTPELLAASGARYSRNNEGLESILSKIDQNDLDKSVDGIFRMIDYGHQSIADMVPVAMFIDEISIWLAYYIWTLCPMAGGQESSTRYIKISPHALIDPTALGIPKNRHEEWTNLMGKCFNAYSYELAIWDDIVEKHPELLNIPQELLQDASEKNIKKIARIKRNYAFDRSRYFLPVAAATNVMLVMSARNWIQLCQNLLAHMLPEPQRLGALIKEELTLCAPRLLRHLEVKQYMVDGIRTEFYTLCTSANGSTREYLKTNASRFDHPVNSALQVFKPDEISAEDIVNDLQFHENRYAWFGENIRRTVVRFSWDAVAFAEIRDLNRHRTGNKCCRLIPLGFYSASDQLPASSIELHDNIHRIAFAGCEASLACLNTLVDGDPSYFYWSLLGTQYSFEHVTTADKFIYEAELRTGAGAHFRYANHFHELLEYWYGYFPATKGHVIEGSAEPE